MLGGHAADRTAFLNALEAEMQRDPGAVAVVRVDLDRFSRIRQTFGPGVARVVRSVILSRLEGLVVRGDHLLRYSEDAFIACITIPDSSPEALELAAMMVMDTISAPIDSESGPQIAVGSNVGIAAAAHFDDSDPLRLLTGAELAIQRANAMGSRRAIVYEVTTRSDPTRLPQLYADMLGAIEDGQFRPVFQPVVSLPGRRISGAEALVRWMHPEHGTLSPAEFMTEAESSGLIRDIDSRVRALAITVAATWPADLTLAVNLSAADLDSPALPSDVEAALAAEGFPASRLVLEVTETALSQDWPRARRRLEALKSIGVRIAVDDFGTGHMFLDRLSTGLFDILKIDRSLIVPEEGEPARRHALLSAVTSMAHTLDMDVVAEGVETEEQCASVTAAGCNRAQGFLFAHPVDAVALATTVASVRD